MKTAEMIPLQPGDLALRVKISFRYVGPSADPRWVTARRQVSGLEVVEVIAVCGDCVTWTNHRRTPRFGGAKFVHVSHRRELIALSALENLPPATDEKSAVPKMAGAVAG